jgi:hypothetical protein
MSVQLKASCSNSPCLNVNAKKTQAQKATLAAKRRSAIRRIFRRAGRRVIMGGWDEAGIVVCGFDDEVLADRWACIADLEDTGQDNG